MLLLPALKRVQHFKRIACMFMLLDMAGPVHTFIGFTIRCRQSEQARCWL